MNVLDEVRETEFLGRDFLTWLWFKSETEGGLFDLGDNGRVELWIDGRITLRSDTDDRMETITCTGENPLLKEARYGLSKDKKITQAHMKLIVGDDVWSFSLDSTWMNFKSFKTPRVVQDQGDDPDGLFFEKVLLIEKAVMVMDDIFSAFIALRISPEWHSEEIPALRRWIEEGM